MPRDGGDLDEAHRDRARRWHHDPLRFPVRQGSAARGDVDEALAGIMLPERRGAGAMTWRCQPASSGASASATHGSPQLLGNTPVFYAPRWLRTLEFSLAALETLGLEVRRAAAIVRLVNNYGVGATLRESSEIRTASRDDEHVAHRAAVSTYLQQVVSSGCYSSFSRLALAMPEGRDLEPDQNFDLGLAA